MNRENREVIIFQLMMHTKFTEQALENMSDERLIKLYKHKVLKE